MLEPLDSDRVEEQAENTYVEFVLLIFAEEVVPLVVEMSMDSISSLGLRMWQKSVFVRVYTNSFYQQFYSEK